MTLNYACALAVFAALAGCANAPKETPSARYIALMPACLLTPPSKPNAYRANLVAKKEEMPYAFSLAQMDALVLCNKQRDSLRTWVSEQQLIYLTP